MPDSRDRQYLMRAVLPDEPQATKRYWWASGLWADQGNTSSCVGHAWAHWVKDGPVTHRKSVDPLGIYRRAQQVDEWPGAEPDYYGTSVRAGAKILREDGLISEYRWAYSVEDIERALLTTGPVVVGTNWYADMSAPDAKGVVKPTGGLIGGHAYLLNGVNTATGLFRAKNSWGRRWAKRGYFYLTRDTLAQLLTERGEACLAVEMASR
jgi:hypothetical protein